MNATRKTTAKKTISLRFVNRATKEERVVGGFRDLQHGWNVAQQLAAGFNWNWVDLHIYYVA